MVVNSRFAVGISTLSVIASEISGFVGHFRLSVVVVIAWPWSQQVLQKLTTSGLIGHIGNTRCRSLSRLLDLLELTMVDCPDLHLE